jgi:tetratricopeptide (TPR) repeat protein
MAQDGQKLSRDRELRDTLSLLRDVDLREVMDQKEELEFRMRVIQTLQAEYDIHRNPRDLQAAIGHAEAAVRLATSPRDKADILNTLSWLTMSDFYLDENASRLNEAIDYARLAHVELETGPDNGEELIRAYENLGHALSAKSQLENDLLALDEAIHCAREVVRLTEDEDLKASCSPNLAIRLHLRYRKTHQESDAMEALRILAESPGVSRPGDGGYAGALLAKGEICFDMYKHDGDLNTLERAIASFEQALGSDPRIDERRVDILRKLSHLYESKHQKTADVSALRTAAKYFSMVVTDTPGHPRKMEFISAQISLLSRLAKVERTLPGIEAALDQARSLFANIPFDHEKWKNSWHYVNFIMADRYMRSRDPAHLKLLVGHVLETGKRWNYGSTRVDLTSAEALQSYLDALARQNPTRFTLKVEDDIYNYFGAAYKAFGPTQAVLNLYREHGPALEQVWRSGSDRITPLGGESIAKLAGAETVTPTQDLSIRRRPLDSSDQPQDPYHNQLTGLRNLALSPSGRIILTVEPMVRDIMGYKEGDPQPRTLSEYLAREARLEAEALQREQDEQKNPNPALCRVCRRMETLKRQGDGTIGWNPKLWLPWGSWFQLRGRSHCAICRLILSLIQIGGVGGEPILHPRLARIDPEVQGIQLEAQRLDTGEVVLGVLYGLVSVGSLRIVSETNRQDAMRAGDVDALLSRVQSWLQTCDLDHGPRCRAFLGEKRCTSPIPLLFVDVVDHCLVNATSAEKYFTLSYVWGGAQEKATTKSNVQQRYQRGSLVDGLCDLPRTIRDAMELVRRLGARYLWVDSLCIVQDDAEHKHRDVRRMDIVYMMSLATIVAAHGQDAFAGLPGIRPRTRNAQVTTSVCIPVSPSASSESQALLLTTTSSPLPLALDSSVWDSRGWVLQEQLLSRRCIYFTSDWVYFQCGRQTVSESASDSLVLARSPKDPRANDSLSMENPLVLLGKLGLISESERLCSAFRVYTQLVEMYVLRDLSFKDDIVDAFSGILTVLEENFAGGFVSALPVAALDLALLWTPGQKMRRRTPSSNAPKSDGFKLYFPSWSWTGWVPWVGHPTYHHIFANINSQPLPKPLIDAFRLHHHGTLHTIRARSSTRALQPATYQTDVPGPDFGPEVLQFWADTVPETAFHFTTSGSNNKAVEYEQLSSRDNVHTKTAQAVIRLRDGEGWHCGLWYDDKNHRLWWAGNREKKPRAELVAVSHLPAPKIEGPKRVEGEIDIFDGRQFPRVGPDSGVVNCLVVEWYDEIAARVTVAQVHWAAWKRARPRRKHIRLV